jgi:hypothetical protein
MHLMALLATSQCQTAVDTNLTLCCTRSFKLCPGVIRCLNAREMKRQENKDNYVMKSVTTSTLKLLSIR